MKQVSDYLKLKEIGKVYTRGSSEQVILSNLNFGIVEKEFVCIMGPSGCGKSTLLKIMGGIEQPTVGEITLKDSTYSFRLKSLSFAARAGKSASMKCWSWWDFWNISAFIRMSSPAV